MFSARIATPAAVPWRAPLLVASALALTLLGPLALLLLTPLVLGVPHVVGDLRCLLLSPAARAQRVPTLAVLAPLALLAGFSAAPLLGLGAWPRAQIACGAAAMLGGVLGAGGSVPVRAMLASAVIALAALACADVTAWLVVLAHGHNLIAFAWYFVWARERREARAALCVYLLAGVALLAGAGDLRLESEFGGLSASKLAAQLAPGSSSELGQRLVSSFAFAQAVHYGVWIWLLPRERATTLRRDLGAWGVALFAASALLVPLVALHDPVWARERYLALASFHGWLELALISFLVARRLSA